MFKTIKHYLKRFLQLIFMSIVGAILLLSIGLLFPKPILESGEDYQSLLLKNVSIVDVKSGTVQPNQNLLVKDNIIQAISATEITPEAHTTTIDAKGQFVMPGLWDMHAHFIHDSPSIHFPMLIANGVTHVREMGFGSPMEQSTDDSILMSLKHLKQWRHDIKNGDIIGPYISRAAVFQIEEYSDLWHKSDEMPPVETIKQVFTDLKNNGVDFIKITLENNPPKLFFYRIMQAANHVGIKVTGHKPRSVSAIEASDLGMLSFEHARFLVIESSSLRDTYLNGSFKGKGSKESLYQTMINSYDPKLAEETFTAFTTNDSWYCPTHITRRWEAHFDDSSYKDDQRVQYIPYLLRMFWKLDAWVMSHKVSSQILDDFYKHGLTITKQAHDSGVQLLAGSDALDPYAFYGSGLVDELGEFEKAQIPTKEILKIATIQSARFAQQQDLFGSIEVNKIADLLILRENPLNKIDNLKTLTAVIAHNKLYRKKDLEHMKHYVANVATSWRFTSHQFWLTIRSLF
jgi:imidazolonepropionase-like amidohydrolase